MTSTTKASINVAKELHQLVQNPPEDVQVIANFDALNEIQAWIKGPDRTPFEGGYFKVKLNLDEDFPQKPPKGYFITKIFHPNVSATGEICVNTLKKDWKPDLGIKHILLTIKCLLIAPNPESALNEEAARLLLEEYDSYASKVKFYTSFHAKSGEKEYTSLQKDRSTSAASIENTSSTHNKSTTAPSSTTLAIKPDTTDTDPNTSMATINTDISNDTAILKSLSNNSPKSAAAIVDDHNIDDNKKRKRTDDATASEETQQQENSSGIKEPKDTENNNEGLIKKKVKIDKRKKSLKRL